VKRRAFFSLFAALHGSSVRAAPKLESRELEISEVSLGTDGAFGRALLCTPRELPKQPELLVLLHGLGETVEQGMGARAFAERYGLLSAVSRLTHPPVVRTDAAHDYFGEGRLSELNGRLQTRPFRCPVLVCPFTPNPYKAGGGELIARFASFVCNDLRLEVESRVGVTFPPFRVMISGVSLGGYLAVEILLKHPDRFCALGTAQGAFGPQQAARYAAAIAAAAGRLGERPVEILTSTFDPYRRSNELFYAQLRRRDQPCTLRVSPGPHDQRWLNESGVIEMLLSADAVFARGRSARP